MAEFTPVKLVRKRDGQTRTATTAAEQVAAAFDGFVVSAGSKAAATRRAAKSTKSTGGKSLTASAGGPVAHNTPKAPASAAADTAK